MLEKRLAYWNRFTLVQHGEGQKIDVLTTPLPAARPVRCRSWAKTGDTAVGFNVHKAVKGHKHFLVSDLMGIVMGVEITPANTGEREGGKVVLKQVKERYPMLENAVVYVDTGFDGPEFAGWVKAELGWEVRVVRKCSPDGIACCEDPNPTPAQIEAAIGRAKQSGFVLLPKRWVIERTNACGQAR